MSEEVKAVHREPHPFIGIKQINQFVGKPVAFVGKIDRFEDNNMIMRTADSKSFLLKNSIYLTNCANESHFNLIR